ISGTTHSGAARSPPTGHARNRNTSGVAATTVPTRETPWFTASTRYVPSGCGYSWRSTVPTTPATLPTSCPPTVSVGISPYRRSKWPVSGRFPNHHSPPPNVLVASACFIHAACSELRVLRRAWVTEPVVVRWPPQRPPTPPTSLR